MPPKYDTTSETSVTFSLAELAKIEAERVHEEEVRREAQHSRAANDAQRALSERRATEAARMAAEEKAREESRRREIEIQTREAARERAAVEVARIEAEARVRLEADNAARAHELAQLRARAESSARSKTTTLAVALAVALVGALGVGYHGSTRSAALVDEAAHAREAADARVSEVSRAKADEIAALARTQAALRRADHLAALDKRREDLSAWAGDRRAESLSFVSRASSRAHAPSSNAEADADAVRAYEVALDQLRTDLTREPVAVAGRPIARVRSSTGAPDPRCVKNPDDPGCGLDGRPIF